MGLETGTLISDLVTTNPPSGDNVSQGDDHIRLLKSVLKNTFPGASKAFYFPTAAAKTANYTILSTESNKFFSGDGTTVAVQFTLPVLTAGDAGWWCAVIAKDITNAVTVVPSSGTINGLASLPFLIANRAYLIWWDGSIWYALASSYLDIAGQTALTAAALDDSLPIYDTSATLNKKIVVSDLFKIINLFDDLVATLAEVPDAGDFLPIWNTSASNLAKVKVSDLLPSPVPGTFSNLSIKVASNTTITCSVDSICLSDGTNSKTVSIGSALLDMSLFGAVNRLDTGGIAAATWYAIFAIAKADGSLPGYLASTSFTAPTMPTGYTLKARIGAVRTASGSANLMGTWQFGNRTRYIKGLAQTSSNVVIASGISGNTTTPTWTAAGVSNYVPSTASFITIRLHSTGGTIIVAPNNTYGGYAASISSGPPLKQSGTTVAIQQDMALESTNVYWASDYSVDGIVCDGWIDTL